MSQNPRSWPGIIVPDSTVQPLTYGAVIDWDLSLGGIGQIVLTASTAPFNKPTNVRNGTFLLFVVQDATGSRTIPSWNAVFKWPLGVVPTLSTAANSIDIFSFVSVNGFMYGSMLKGMA